MLNSQLADSMNLSEQTQETIKRYQLNRENMIHDAQSLIHDDEGSVDLRKRLLLSFQENEKVLQKLWGFGDNAHLRFMQELKLPGCTCPYLDNKDAQGLVRYMHESCKWHK